MKNLCAAALAAAGLAGGQALAADAYAFDPAHTQIVFSVERFGFNDVVAFFADVRGVVTLDADNPENSAVEAEIAVAGLESGDATRDAHVLGGLWLKAAEFPTIAFRSTAVVRTGEATARVTGDLTVMGQARPVTLDVALNRIGTDPATKRQAAGFSATATLNRADFGITTASALIGDEVKVRIEALAHKAENYSIGR